MKKYNIYIILLAILATSCGESFYPDFDTEPIAVLNSMITPGNKIKATVSHSFIGSNEYRVEDVNNRIVKDAKVELYVNNGYKGDLIFDTHDNCFVSDVIINPDDDVMLHATTSKYGNASGQTHVPSTVEGATWTYTVTTETDYDTTLIDWDGNISHPKATVFNYAITFKDPGDSENYYFLMSESSDFECNDPIIGEIDSPLDAVYSRNSRYLIFTDKSISGKEYTLNCSFKISRTWDTFGFNEVCLYSISKDYYLYLLSLYKKYEGLNGALEEFGLAEPKFIYSNVNPGVGIVAAQTKVLDIKHDIRDYLEKD